MKTCLFICVGLLTTSFAVSTVSTDANTSVTTEITSATTEAPDTEATEGANTTIADGKGGVVSESSQIRVVELNVLKEIERLKSSLGVLPENERWLVPDPKAINQAVQDYRSGKRDNPLLTKIILAELDALGKHDKHIEESTTFGTTHDTGSTTIGNDTGSTTIANVAGPGPSGNAPGAGGAQQACYKKSGKKYKKDKAKYQSQAKCKKNKRKWGVLSADSKSVS